MNQNKVPLFIIFIAILFILVLVILLSSIGSSNPEVTKGKVLHKSVKKVKFNNVNIHALAVTKESDCLCFTFDDLSKDISYIFGSEMDNSIVSVYRIVSEDSLQENLIFTKEYSGNQGFVLSSNPLNINASYFQLGTKLDLQTIKYNCIYLESGYKYKVCVNNSPSQIFKVYRFTINYSIRESKASSLNFGKNLIGLSEYDLEKKIKLEYPNIGDRNKLQRLAVKQWSFKKEGKFLIAYLKDKYNFTIKNNKNGEEWKSENKLSLGSSKLNSVSKNPTLNYVILENPDLLITNLDENLNQKSFNDDFLEFINTPFTMYDHFLNGPKRKKVDVINKISNKILVFKI
jgi:hypothetical protein